MFWALSKDFGSSGFRVGCVYSQNQAYLSALSNLNIFSIVSHPIQAVAADLLCEDVFVDKFLDDARVRLRKSYEMCTKKLEEMGFPYVRAEAGLFVYVDFSSLLPSKTFEAETKLEEMMMKHARVVVTPGKSQRERNPGMFRICYAWVSAEVLAIAMERLGKLFDKIKTTDWAELNESTLQGIL
mmetsp:Transcript_14351/g.33144  ORF Transcript_14351/g.33144 Transcript_14351/m.33144 type:complete len:184 (+) Transcript_14351:1087-1638(+)